MEIYLLENFSFYYEYNILNKYMTIFHSIFELAIINHTFKRIYSFYLSNQVYCHKVVHIYHPFSTVRIYSDIPFFITDTENLLLVF